MKRIIVLLLLKYLELCTAEIETLEEGPFNFDIETKRRSKLPSCHFDFKYELPKGIISVACFLIGIFVLLFGYKRRRISFCCLGLSSTSILTYMILLAEQKFSLAINILISLSTGLIVSLFMSVLLYCGYFMTGLFAGFVVGVAFLLAFTSFSAVLSIASSCVILAGFGLVQVFITMWWRHHVYIVSSCILASAIVVCTLDYFVEGLFLLRYIEMKVFYNKEAELCWWSYLMFAVFPLFIVIGLIIQCFYTGKEMQKEPYTFVYFTRRRSKNSERENITRPAEENFLINSNG